MLYSVETPDHRFRYYEGPGTFPPSGAYRTPRGNPINGLFPPNQFLPLLPGGSKVVGDGEDARGILCVMPTGLFGEVPEPVKKWGPPLALGVFAGWLTRKWWRK